MEIRGSFETDDFFDRNPELKYIDDFAGLIKDKGAEKASKIMWAIWLTESPDSNLYSLGVDVRRENVKKNYVKDKSFNFDDYAWLITSFRRYTMSNKARMYADYQEIMDRRHKLLMELSLEYDQNSKEIDDMMLKTQKIWAELEKIEKEFLDSKDGGIHIKGGGKMSATDSGLLD
jgi:hypothetical protein